MAKAKVAPGRSLLDYVMAKRRATCKVCQLPEEIRAQVREARDKKIELRVIREWLKTEHGVEIVETDVTSHRNRHHDEEGRP